MAGMAIAPRVGHGGRVRHVFENDKTVPQPRRGLGAGKSVAACRKPRVPVSSDLRWPDAPLVADARNRPGPCPQHGPGLLVHGLRVERPTQIARVDRRAEGTPRVGIWFRLRRYGAVVECEGAPAPGGGEPVEDLGAFVHPGLVARVPFDAGEAVRAVFREFGVLQTVRAVEAGQQFDAFHQQVGLVVASVGVVESDDAFERVGHGFPRVVVGEGCGHGRAVSSIGGRECPPDAPHFIRIWGGAGLFTCMHGLPPQAAFAGQESDDVPLLHGGAHVDLARGPVLVRPFAHVGDGEAGIRFHRIPVCGAMETVCHPCPVIPFDRVEVETIGAQGEPPVLGGHRGRLKIMHADVRRIRRRRDEHGQQTQQRGRYGNAPRAMRLSMSHRPSG